MLKRCALGFPGFPISIEKPLNGIGAPYKGLMKRIGNPLEIRKGILKKHWNPLTNALSNDTVHPDCMIGNPVLRNQGPPIRIS